MPIDPSTQFQSITSATQQTQNTLASAGNLVTSFSQSATAMGAQAVQSVRDIAENLAGAGISMWNSTVGGINTLLGDSVGKLNQLPSPPKITDNAPQNIVKPTYNPSILQYPPDMPPYHIHFAFRSYERPTAVETAKKNTTANIFLPLPPSLVESYSMRLSELEMGNLFNTAQDTAQGDMSAAGNVARGESGGMKAAAVGTGGVVGDLFGRGAEARGAASQSLGSVPNPHIGMVFNGVNFRAPHTFTYRFSPRNAQESKTLRSIIKEFKVRMHPLQRSFSFDYPDVVDIKIIRPNDPEPLIKYKTCFLESLSVNYAPNGVPTFFAGTREPTDIELSMQFKEIEIFARGDFDGSGSVFQGNTDTGGK